MDNGDKLELEDQIFKLITEFNNSHDDQVNSIILKNKEFEIIGKGCPLNLLVNIEVGLKYHPNKATC